MAVSALAIPKREIEALCRRRNIVWLALFGSVLTDRFRAESDVDVLVEFAPGHAPGLAVVDVEDELSALFGGHKVDLILKQDLSRWIRGRVLAEAQMLFGSQVRYGEG